MVVLLVGLFDHVYALASIFIHTVVVILSYPIISCIHAYSCPGYILIYISISCFPMILFVVNLIVVIFRYFRHVHQINYDIYFQQCLI